MAFPLRKVLLAAAVGITAILIFATFSRWQQLESFSSGDLSSLPATIIREPVGSDIDGVEVRVIGEQSLGTRPDPAHLQPMTINDKEGNLVIRIYHGEEFFGKEIVAGEIMNGGPNEITVSSFLIAGVTHCYLDTPNACNVQRLYRPIISNNHDVVKPVTTEYAVLQPGETLSAYIKGNFYQDGYGASSCYSHDVNDQNQFYCISTDVVFLR